VAATRPAPIARESGGVRAGRRPWADNLKVVLVACVIVAHVTMAWTGVGNWVFTETPVREPLWSLLVFVSGVGALFGMALFFVIAGMFTPSSLARKGTRRFIVDRTIRLGVPLLVFVAFLAPVIEYVDPENADWTGGFVTFAVDTVWWAWPLPPAWGPAWFLAVLLLFSYAYAGWRAWRPARASGPLRLRGLLAAAVVLAGAAFAVRTQVPLGTEVARLALGQSPAWVAGFTLGVLAGERHWFDPVDPRLARHARHIAWAGVAAFAVVIAGAMAAGMAIEDFYGGATWQSAVVCCIEAALVLSMPIWLMDLFQRRFDRQGRLLRAAGRAAFAAFLVHQAVLVALVLATHALSLPPEVDYVSVAVLGVLGSFVLGAVLVRLPGVSRVL
jgi:fucose 4-O-acetylase-like acetyltransferase